MPQEQPSLPVAAADPITGEEHAELAALREVIAALDAENARLRATVEHMTDAYWAVDRDWRLTYINATAEQIWGRSRESLLGKRIWEEFPAVVGTQNYEAIVRAMEQRTIEDFEDRSPALDLWVSGRAYPMPGGLAVHFQDITPRRRREAKWQESEERYRAVLDAIDEGFCVFEMLFDASGRAVDYRFIETNPAFEQHTGLHGAPGKRMRELAPDHEAHWFRTYGEVARTGEPARFVEEARALDGRWFDVYAFRLGGSESRTVGAIFADVTARRRAETDLARLAAIVEDSRDAIIGCDLNGTIVDWNRGAESLFGYAATEVVGHEISLVAPDDRRGEWPELFGRLRQAEAVPANDTVGVRKDGTSIDIEIRLSPITDASGHVAAVSAIARDLTERKRMERVQQDFIAMASHDLAGPVTVLRARAQLMQRRQAYDEAGIDSIIEQTKRMERLIADLRELARLETGQFELERETIDLVNLAHAAAERARVQSQQRLIRVDAPTCVSGHWDGDRLGQILDNLLSNALKYSPEEREVTIRVTSAGDEACVSVIDQGAGIAPEALPHLFERFYRAEQRGSAPGLGLGLYITRMLVEAHGGRVWVESAPATGSTFTVAVPLGSEALEE
jgi:PAS domain S-box-containing protein